MPTIKILPHPEYCPNGTEIRADPGTSVCEALLEHDIPIEHAWEGRFANTPDTLPYVGPHRRYPGHAFALGYGGNGMTFGSLAGRLLVEQFRGVASKDHALFAFDRG